MTKEELKTTIAKAAQGFLIAIFKDCDRIDKDVLARVTTAYITGATDFAELVRKDFIKESRGWLKEKAELYAELDYYDDYENDGDVCRPYVKFDIGGFLADFEKAMTKEE